MGMYAEAAADAAAGLLADEVAPHAAKARQDVLELGELYLEPPLVRPGVDAEDVEDERGAVDDLDGLPHRALEVRLLRGGELVVEDDDVGPELADERAELLDLAAPDERPRHGGVEALVHGMDDLGPVGLGEAGELGEGLLAGPLRPAEVHADENGALRHGRRRERAKSRHGAHPRARRRWPARRPPA